MRSRYCKVCGGWHGTDDPWPEECFGHFRPRGASIQIIKDIEPYRAVAVDIATGKPPVLGGRRQHREFLKRNGYYEVGNEPIRPRKPEYDDIHPREIVQTIERIKSERGR